MKKVLAAIGIILFLAVLGVGGFFAYKVFMAKDNNKIASSDDSEFPYQMSTDIRFESNIKSLKKQLKKKDAAAMIDSLDYEMDMFIESLPVEYQDLVWSQLAMPSDDTVIIADMSMIDERFMDEYVIARIETDQFVVDNEQADMLRAIIDMVLTPEETEPETTQAAQQEEVVNFTPSDDFTMSYREGVKFEDKQFIELEEGLAAYKKALNNDANAKIVEDYVNGIIENAVGDKPYTFTYFDEESNKFSLLFDLDGRYLLIFEIDTEGNMVDYSSVYNDFMSNYVSKWYKVFPDTSQYDDFSGLINETEEGDEPIPNNGPAGNTDF